MIYVNMFLLKKGLRENTETKSGKSACAKFQEVENEVR